MRIRAVSFDLFDTLVDLSMEGLPRTRVGERELPSTLGALHEHVARHHPISLEAFAEVAWEVERELRELRREAGRELPTRERFEAVVTRIGLERPELPTELTRIHMELLRGQVTALPHHTGVVDRLREQGVRVGVCSNFSHSETALRVLEEAELRWKLDAVVVSDAVTWRKPRPEIFHCTLAALGVSPEECLHVGDSLRADVAGASALGMPTAWITRRIPDLEKARANEPQAIPDFTIGDLSEILDLVEA